MAKRRKHRRSFGSIVSTKFGDLPVINESVSGMDVIVGAGIGIVGSAVVKAVFKKFLPSVYAQVASTVGAAMPALVGGGAGAILYFAEKKTKRAAGHALGAGLVGLVLAGWDFARGQLAGKSEWLDFSGVTGVNLGRPYGMLVADQSDASKGVAGYGGVLVADHSDALSELAAVSMGHDDDGISALMGM